VICTQICGRVTSLLFLINNRYFATDQVVVKNHLVRILYRLALDGVDVNARDGKGDTILIKAFHDEDRRLLEHVIRIGRFILPKTL
jgi:hypothetical protein